MAGMMVTNPTLPRPLVYLFANKFYLLIVYACIFLCASLYDVDVGAVVGIAFGYFHMSYLRRAARATTAR